MKVGIDFGNTVSRVAYLNEQGIPEVFSDFEDPNVRNTPSLIHIGQRGCLVGASLERLLEIEPAIPVARNCKRELGTRNETYTDEAGQAYHAAELASLVLRKLVHDAEKAASESVEGTVIAVPSWFQSGERQALVDAAEMAGLPQVELVPEPLAVVHHYGLDHSSRERNLLVYDLGASTFEATLVRSGPEGIRELASTYLDRGGHELDSGIRELVRECFHFTHGFDPEDDPVAAVQVRHFAEQIKLELGQPGRDHVGRATLLCGKPLEFSLSRTQLDRLLSPLLNETMKACRQCLDQASVSWGRVDAVLLSGSSARMAAVSRTLVEQSKLETDRVHLKQPDLAVAFGAAHLTRNFQENRTRDLSLGPRPRPVMNRDLVIQSLVPGGREVEEFVVLKKGSPLPAQREFRCLTARDGQTTLEFDWAFRTGPDEPSSGSAEPLGRSVFDRLPGGAKGHPVDLTVTAQLDGAIRIVATDPMSGEQSLHTLDYRERRECAEREQQRERLLCLSINHS